MATAAATADVVVARPAALLPALRYVEREARVWRRLWRGGVFSGLVTPILFLGAMGLGLGGLVDDKGSVSGLDYLTFVAPGLLAASALQSAAGSSLWPVMGGVKWQGHFNAAVASPLRPADVYFGYVTWIGIQVGMHAVPFVIVAALLGGVPSAWAILAIPAAVLCALAFAAPLVAFAVVQQTDVYFAVVMRILVLPMFLFSGTFFPLENLPAGIRPVAWITPLWHGVELCRGATTGSLGLAAALGHIAFLAGCIAAGALWGVRNFSRRLTP
ncbi:MAG TPA: ABC transporter permease [Acidimicrobiales bacterium]